MTDGQGKAGRPTLYRPEMCEQVIGWGKRGKSRVWMCSQLGVVRTTFQNWEAAHPEFAEALALAKVHEQAFYEDIGEAGMMSSGFQATVWSRSMAARFHEDWREVTRQERTGPDGGPQQLNVTNDAVAELTRRLSRLAAAGSTSGDAGDAE